jgi:O-antigen/teichoic acid export membrane protein
MGDQAASGLSNVVVAILVARSVGAAGFGAFGLAMVVYQLVVGLVRSLAGEPFLARHSHQAAATRAEAVPGLLGAAVTVAAAAAVVTAVAGAVTGGLAGSALVALAVVLPLVMVQDTWRFVFVVDRPAAALVIDLVWLVLVAAAMVAAPESASVAWYVVVWGLGGGVAAVVAALMGGVELRAVHPWRWLVETRHDGSRYVGDFLTAQASAQAAYLVLGAVSGLATLGAVRASHVFYGPLNTVHTGVYLAVVPDGAQLRGDRDRLHRLIVRTAAVLAGLAAAWMLVGVVMPDSIGEALFGSSWPGAEELMVPMGVSGIVGGVMAGGFFGIRSLGAAHASLRARVLSAPGLFLLPVAGAVVGGAVGFVLGVAAGRVLGSVIWWSLFQRHLALGEAGAVAVTVPDAEGEAVTVAMAGAAEDA